MFVVSVIIGVFMGLGLIFIIDTIILCCCVSRPTRRKLLGFKDDDGVVTWYYKGQDGLTKGPFDTYTMQQMYLEGQFADEAMVRKGLHGKWEPISDHFQDLGHSAKIWYVEGDNGGPYSNEEMREKMDDAEIDASTQIQLSNQIGRYAAVGQFFPDLATAFLCAPRQPGMKALQLQPVHQEGAEEFFDMQALSVKSGQMKKKSTGKSPLSKLKGNVNWQAHAKSMASSCGDGSEDILCKTTTKYAKEAQGGLRHVPTGQHGKDKGKQDEASDEDEEAEIGTQSQDLETAEGKIGTESQELEGEEGQDGFEVDPVTGKKKRSIQAQALNHQKYGQRSSKFGIMPKLGALTAFGKLAPRDEKKAAPAANQFGWSSHGPIPKK